MRLCPTQPPGLLLVAFALIVLLSGCAASLEPLAPQLEPIPVWTSPEKVDTQLS